MTFILSGNPSHELFGIPSFYTPFTHTALPKNDKIEINLSLDFNRSPSVKKLEKIFDSGQAWAMYRSDACRVMTFGTPDFDSPLWVAEINHSFTRVTVYCSKHFVTKHNGKMLVSTPLAYPLDQILLMYILARKNGFVIHATGFIHQGKSFIFPGKSGAGKSTLSRTIRGLDDMELLSDDRIAVRKSGSGYQAYGTPWPGDAGIAVNKGAKLHAIFLLHQGQENRIRVMDSREALERMLPVISVPWYDKDVLQDVLSSCEELISTVPVYELSFTRDIDIRKTLPIVFE